MHSLQPSTLPSLTEEVAINSIRDLFRGKPFVFFGTGISCALDVRFGMPALKDSLSQSVARDAQAPEQERQWQQVVQSLQNGGDLESALDNVTDSALLQKITSATGSFVASLDREYAFRIAKGEATWPATRFVKRLVDNGPPADIL